MLNETHCDDPVPTELSAATQQEYRLYGRSPEIVIEVEALFEVRKEREGCPEAVQRTEYLVTGAEAGTEGEGCDQETLTEEEATLDALTL